MSMTLDDLQEACRQLEERVRGIERDIATVPTGAQRFVLDIGQDGVSGTLRWTGLDGSVDRYDVNLSDERGWYLTTGHGQMLALAKDPAHMAMLMRTWFGKEVV